MGALVSFFSGPAQLKALLAGAAAMVAVCLAAVSVALWYRGEAYQARGERDLAIAQSKVLAQGIAACSAGVAAAHEAAGRAVSQSRQLLAEAQRLHAGGVAQAKRIEELLKQKPPARPDGKPAGCDEAWDRIEQESQGVRWRN